MNKLVFYGIPGLLNIVVFVLHYRFYEKSRGMRKSWAAATIGAGLGPSTFPFVEWLYGLEADILIIVLGFSISISGIGMYLLNKFDTRSLTSM